MPSSLTPITWSRRHFLGAVAASSTSLPFVSHMSFAAPAKEEKMSIHIFSKHLQFLDYEAMAETAAAIGFDGVDLTVRPEGHVLPENVKTDLPQAVAAIQKNGLQAITMTSAIMDAQDPVNQTVLKTAHDQGIRYYRTHWLRYDNDDINLPQSLEPQRAQLKALAQLNEQTSMYGGYQNHSGPRYVGGPVWDIAMLLREINSEYLGSQYDIRHATAEGGQSWPLGLDLIHPYINTLVIKDFYWGKVDGEWKVVNTPLGEGMVDFPQFFQRIKDYGIRVPISVHFEYPLPSEDDSLSPEEKRKQTIAVMKKDVDTLRGYLAEAGLG